MNSLLFCALVGLVIIAGIAGLFALVIAVTLIRRKIRKEIGLWKRHLAYRPQPPSRERRLE